ncbi:TPA: hypothetical protein ACH3X3_007752 [Trebouxia sp. C0006]
MNHPPADSSAQQRTGRAMGERPGVARQNFTSQFVVEAPGARRIVEAVETDPHRIAQRQKQIDYGKNTLGYQRYTEEVPRYLRRKISTRISKHPETPDVTQICSKRSFDGQAKKWRRQLHLWDPEEEEKLIEPVLQLAQPVESPEGSESSRASIRAVHAPVPAAAPAPVLPTVEDPAPSTFLSPKKQKTDTGHAVPQHPSQPRLDVASTAAVPRKTVSTGSKRSYQEMDNEATGSGHMTYGAHADAITELIEPKQEPEDEQAPWDDLKTEDPETSTAAAAARQPNDIFGPADEFD